MYIYLLCTLIFRYVSNAKPKTLPTNWALDMNMSVPT